MLDPEASTLQANRPHFEPPDRPSHGDPDTIFDREYYERGCGPLAYARTSHWLNFFGALADHLIRTVRPTRVLDAGCAMGMLVESLWDRGVEAWGVDVSTYAISQVRRDMQAYCRAASLTEPLDASYDLITCIEVLEHMSAEDAHAAAENMCRATDTIFFSSTPDDFTEPTHVNVRPTIYWLKLFAAFGFQPVLQFDCDALIPHGILLHRRSQALPIEALELFADHLRKKSILTRQTLEIRELTKINAEQQAVQSREREALEQMRSLLAHAEAERDNLRQELDGERAQRERDTATSQARELETLQREFVLLREQQRADAEKRERREAEFEGMAARLRSVEQRTSASDVAIAHLTSRHGRLQDSVATLGKRTEHVRAALDQLQMGVSDLQAGLKQVGAKTESILQSMIWRSLRAGGAVMLNLTGIPRRLLGGPRTPQPLPPTENEILLICDEPAEGAPPRTGRIRVSGWACAPAGIDRVEIWVDDGEARKAEFGLTRPDVGRSLPHLNRASHSGFLMELDSRDVPSGAHLLRLRAWDSTGVCRTVTRRIQIDHESGDEDGYGRWMKDFEKRDQEEIEAILGRISDPQLISILMPAYKSQPDLLSRAIDSVLSQSYPHWELCIADDFSDSAELEGLLHNYVRRDPRIRVVFRKKRGGISAASNTALELASGAWIGLLDHDDELATDALLYVADAICGSSNVDLIYSDEDKISEGGHRYDPFFKPDWSPDLLRSENYICHFLTFRKSLLQETGAFRSECDGSQDYDLILRLSEITRGIHHIPRILYHWRSAPTSTASSPSLKSYAVDSAERALADHLARSALRAAVEPGLYAGRWRVRYPILEGTRVSIIVASGGNREILENNLAALISKTTYPHFELVVIDNSRGGEIETLVREWRSRTSTLRYVDWRNKPFNYSAINNAAARQCNSPVLLFLNDDTSVIEPGWLEAMLELAVRPEVGAVGAKLLYPGGQIQHAGVIMGVFDNCGHAFKGCDGSQQHYFDLPDVIRNVSAVTGACLMTRAECFWKVGGFDEDKFAVAFNDIDLCLKIGQAGYRILYTPHALLTHHEAFSKSDDDLVPHPREVAEMQSKWARVIAADPYYSPNLSRTLENYSFRQKPSQSSSRPAEADDREAIRSGVTE